MKLRVINFFMVIVVCCSCSISYLDTNQVQTKVVNTQSQIQTQTWTHLVYMAADNSLDSQSLNDLNEIEAAQDVSDFGMHCLVLIDRSKNNDDWSDTRLYEVKHTPGSNSAHIVSKQIDCPPLGISATNSTELNMADPLVLERFICFALEHYQAEKYSLTIWGHGTGWRGSADTIRSEVLPLKAVALDDTSDSYMRVSELAQALINAQNQTNTKLDVLGFDTCFGSLLEVAYPLRDCAQYLVGSAGPIKDTGWNYTHLFNFLCESNLEPLDFCNAIQQQFSISYSNTENATISILDLNKTVDVQFQFNAWAQEQASFIESIPTIQDRNYYINTIRNLLLNDIDAFYFPSASSDYYVDVLSLMAHISALTKRYPSTHLLTLIENFIVSSWSKKYENQKKQVGIYIGGINSNKVFDTTHSKEYTIGSGAVVNPFVLDSPGWSVHQNKAQISFLNLIFYK